MRPRLCLLVFLLLSTAGLASGRPKDGDDWRRARWVTDDGVQLAGIYRPSSRPRARTWVLLHGLGSVKEEWQSFGRRLAAQGNGVFLYDARGHQESTRRRDGSTLSYQEWRQAGPGTPWARMPSDLESAVRFVHREYGVDPSRIAVGGASLGANVALVYAGRHPEVPAVVLLSPGMAYAGIAIQDAFKAYGQRPLLLAASPGDEYAYASVQNLVRQRGDDALRLLVGPGGEHGVNMLKESSFADNLLEWMKQ